MSPLPTSSTTVLTPVGPVSHPIESLAHAQVRESDSEPEPASLFSSSYIPDKLSWVAFPFLPLHDRFSWGRANIDAERFDSLDVYDCTLVK